MGWIGVLEHDLPQIRGEPLHTCPGQDKGLFQEPSCLGHRGGSVTLSLRGFMGSNLCSHFDLAPGSGSSHINEHIDAIISLYSIGEETGTKVLNELPKVTQLGSGSARI